MFSYIPRICLPDKTLTTKNPSLNEQQIVFALNLSYNPKLKWSERIT